MKITPTKLDGVVILQPNVYPDSRGFFFELWNKKRNTEAGLPADLVQDNVSFSNKGVLRGLHLQNPNPQGKLVSVLHGEIFDVAVDVREGSPTFGEWISVVLTGALHNQLYIPPGFAHGFQVLSENATVMYKTTDYWSPSSERTLLWNDPAIGIEWPIAEPIVSAKDAQGVSLAEIVKFSNFPSVTTPGISPEGVISSKI